MNHSQSCILVAALRQDRDALCLRKGVDIGENVVVQGKGVKQPDGDLGKAVHERVSHHLQLGIEVNDILLLLCRHIARAVGVNQVERGNGEEDKVARPYGVHALQGVEVGE